MFHISKAGKASLIAAFGLALAGCGGSDGRDGQDGQNGVDGLDGVTTRVTDIAPGAECASGGIEVGLGVDADGDGELSDEEVTQAKIICNGDDGADGADGADGSDGVDGTDGQDGTDGTDGANALIKLTTEPAGLNCAAGGYRLDTGLDNGDGGETPADGVLGTGEIDATNYVCHGVDGFTVLTTLTPAAAGNCPNGGQRLDIGLDNGDNLGTPRDGNLQTGEIDSTGYICNGADGQDGADGLNGADGADGTDGTNGTDGTDGTNGSDGADGSNGQDGQTTLIKQAMASVANCPDGGVTITSGLDNGDGAGIANNALLEAGEVDYTQHVCNGSAGGGNQLVDANSVVLGSVLNANLETVSIRTPNNYLVTINWDGSFNPEDTTYSATGCTGTPHIYIDDKQKTIHPLAAFWSANESGFLVPNNPGADAAVESQDLPYESYMLDEVCTTDSGTVWMWPASVFSATTIGLPATIVAPLTLQ